MPVAIIIIYVTRTATPGLVSLQNIGANQALNMI